MFYVSSEFRKGVFFIRLKGRIDNEGYLDEVSDLIDYMGFRVIVINISDLNNLSIDNVSKINKYYKKVLKEKRLLYICDSYNIGDNLFKFIPSLKSEIAAFSLI